MINVLLSILSLASSLHDYHITHTTLNFNDTSQSIETTVKVAIDELELAHGDGRFPRVFRALTKTQLLILDDWGPDRLNASQRRDLMEIVEDRYGAGSTLITSQLPVSTWHEVIGEPTFADAILDRLVHNAYRLELEGQSFRKKAVTNG